LLSILAIASIIGTVVQQNQPAQNYVVQFGPFWAEIFQFLGLFDVYASSWFVLIMLFLVLSTGLCVWRNTPQYLRDMKSFRLNATAKSLAHMKHTAELPHENGSGITPEIAEKYLQIHGFKTKSEMREDGSVIVAAKKGAMNKWGYIFAHLALIVICIGGLIDSNLLLKIGMLTGRLVPDNTSVYARDFKPESTLSDKNLSYRGNAEIVEGQTIDRTFLNADKGLLLQELPFSIELKKFHIDFYDTGMPKDFASDVLVTDKYTGEKMAATLRVNHPLTVNGVTIYQSTYGDGGSDIRLKSWDLRGADKPAEIKAVSQREFPLDFGNGEHYRLEFGELRVFNVEDLNATASMPTDARAVNQKKFQNVGPTITYKLRDKAGQAREYVNYMLPLRRGGDFYFATGERGSNSEDYRWLMIPADKNGKPDTFMHLRAVLLQPELREAVLDRAVADMPEPSKARFREALGNILELFAREGYVGINQFVENKIPAAEQDRMRELFYQMLFGAGNIALEQALSEQGLDWPQSEERNRFLINSFDAYTGLTRFGSPVLLQLNGYNEVKSSGLQMTRSPGQGLVYLGSVLLILGTALMFYLREQRAWLLYDHGQARFAMSSARLKRQLEPIFATHTQHLTRLAQELNHDQP